MTCVYLHRHHLQHLGVGIIRWDEMVKSHAIIINFSGQIRGQQEGHKSELSLSKGTCTHAGGRSPRSPCTQPKHSSRTTRSPGTSGRTSRLYIVLKVSLASSGPAGCGNFGTNNSKCHGAWGRRRCMETKVLQFGS